MSVAILGFWASASRADEKDRPTDEKFLVKLASCGHTVVELSKLADKQNASAPVKEFATMMITDHQKCSEKVAEEIKNRKIAVVTGLEPAAKADRDRLNQLKGDEFDRAYMDWTINGHKEAIAIFDNQIKNGKDAQIRSFAQENLPKMQEHLKRAEEIRKNVK